MADSSNTEPSTPRVTTASRPAATSSSNLDTSDGAQLRKRSAKRAQNDRLSSPKRSPIRRRSSLLSYTSIDDMRNSFHEDILQPASSKRRQSSSEHEISHWSSTPLAFAILPAIAGTFFSNGSAFVTDVLLLAFAAVFLNWSIRVPREWYYSAQAIRREVEPDMTVGMDEDDEDESAIEEESEDTLKTSPTAATASTPNPLDNTARLEASEQLKRQETTALFCTFLFPALAAYFLHVIRAQLSLPSTSLVSDYNISIFLLAAEFWPARQVVRLVAARTLHLQRTASGLDDPFADSLAKGVDKQLLARLDALEAKLEEQAVTSPNGSGPTLKPADLASFDARIQKRLEPRLDSLERAVRRYEKRYTTLAMVSEQRFGNLETRLQDALSLAAVAAQAGQRQTTILSTAIGAATDIVLLPARLAWELVVWPYKVVDEMYQRFKVLMLGPRSSTADYAGKKKFATKHYGDVKIKDDKIFREKQASRRLVR